MINFEEMKAEMGPLFIKYNCIGVLLLVQAGYADPVFINASSDEVDKAFNIALQIAADELGIPCSSTPDEII